ncbi:MAG: GNAT family N-acetyltransferase [Roseitalea sp.]|jgi:hypothetical protein|nr:GNAT family N-acetyltransferase [Roseitalea sp.]MBO6722765.1 GNAT family N-acetyltransferase [Roseitalea sp.]MBO6745161.1 GNAT family N-acetyltransferase [Roseitalea sp.]
MTVPINDEAEARATLYLAPDVVAALAQVYGCQPLPLGMEWDGNPIHAYRVRRPGTDRILLAPFNFQPILHNHADDIAKAVVSLAKRTGPKTSARIKLHRPLDADLVKELGLTPSVDGLETLVRLDGGLDAVRGRMRKRHRSKLRPVQRLATEAQIAIRRFDDNETLGRFYPLMVEAYRDKHRMLAQPLSIFQRLLVAGDADRGMHGYAAVDQATGELAGGILLLTDQTQWCYGWGANRALYAEHEIGTLLLSQALSDAIQSGARVFSLGMSAVSQSGLRQYKRGWGGEEHEVHTYHFREPASSVDLHSDFAFAKRVIAMTPLPVLRGLSPVAVRWLV